MRKITTVLIANRGEIARRIQSSCHALGINTIAIYTQEDTQLSYIFSATQAYRLNQNGIAGYLDQDEIIAIAQRSGADAIHPGYGFLAENVSFAQKVIDAGLIWIGPTPKSMALLANKIQARMTMEQASIPVIPGAFFNARDAHSCSRARQAAIEIGFPVILKCAHGGGGKAMRRINSAKVFTAAWNTVVSESEKFFTSHELLLEKYIERARHLEVQISGDGKNFIHLYERECTIQRRHQKIIEEAPSLFVSQKTKQNLYQTALRVAQSVSYCNIGTVEFIVTPNEQCYFLEVNTRLQVEHSVTELTTGVDLVALQLHIAQHGTLPYTQNEITQRGHAIECRIYAEDSAHNFAPSTGTLTGLEFPTHPFLRSEHDLAAGMEITPFFDPMIAKLTTHAQSRELAKQYMIDVLTRTLISGIQTNASFLTSILQDPVFDLGNFYTTFIEKEFLNNYACPKTHTQTDFIGACAAHALLKILTRPTKQTPVNRSSSWGKQRWE